MAGTQVMQTKAFKVGSVQRGTVLQLLLCHCFIFTVAIIFGANTLSILCACLLSFLLMLNIPYNLHLLEITLDRLARSLPVEPIPLRLRWPLTGLFVRVNTLGKQSGLQVQMEQRNVAYRDQLLQQVGKTAAQEERNRLARDLHDSIKQQLFSIVVSAAAVKARWEHNPASAYKVVDDIERTAQEAQVEMQALLQQLRPTALENVGLIESLRMQCQALGYRTGAEVTAELGDLPPDELLPIGAQEMVFRIVQEGFANIARHARASHVWLSLRRQRDALLVEIGDDGQGFDLAQANERPHTYDGMGLSNVRERIAALGGTIAIWSLPGKGTTLHLCIPLVQPHAHEQERVNQELATAVHKTRRILRIGIWAAELAAILMLLYTPAFIALWAALICIIAALASWLLAQQYRLQVSLEFGREHTQSIALLSESYGLLSGTLLLGMLYPNYFKLFYYPFDFAFIPMKFIANNVWLVSGFFGVFITAIVVTYVLYARNIDRYYKTLSGKSLREQLRQQFQQLVIDWLAWAIVVGLTVFLLNFLPTISTEPTVQGTGLILLCAWFIIILLKSIRTARWHRVPVKDTPTMDGARQQRGGQRMTEQIRVVLVDDHRVVRQGLRTYLESFPDLEIVGESSSGEEVLRHIEMWLPDVVVMDLLMPGGMDGVETIRRLRQLTPHTQIIALTSYTDDARVIAVLRAGAIGYVRKDAAPDVLLAAIHAAAHGRSLLDPAVAGAVLQELARGEKPEVALSEREQDVLRQLALGRTNREIAESMMVSPETVKTHVGNILAKLHLAHRTQAVIYALKSGVISLDDIEL